MSVTFVMFIFEIIYVFMSFFRFSSFLCTNRDYNKLQNLLSNHNNLLALGWAERSSRVGDDGLDYTLDSILSQIEIIMRAS